MEFTTGERFKIAVTASDVGKRVSVRSMITPDHGVGKFTDTVGVLTSWTDGVLCITRRHGERVRIDESLLVAGKVVPATPARRRGLPSAQVPELVRVAARAWPPVESAALGSWRLRASYSRPAAEGTHPRGVGFTRRANSALPLGDPGIALDTALQRVDDWYQARGLPTYLQVTTGTAQTGELLGAELEERGWSAEGAAEIRIAALAPLADTLADTRQVTLSRDVDPSWIARCHRFAGRGARAEELAVLRGGPSVWFATVPGDHPREAATAIGRCVVDGRWAGFTALEVDPTRRRTGWATAVMATLAGKALEEGASAAYLEIEADNESARALYDTLGFAWHHSYHHWRAPRG